jgi:invasion protein IalB
MMHSNGQTPGQYQACRGSALWATARHLDTGAAFTADRYHGEALNGQLQQSFAGASGRTPEDWVLSCSLNA